MATRPAITSTSATTAACSPNCSVTWAARRCSTATATPAASAWRPWPEEPARSPASTPPARPWRAPRTTSPSTASTPRPPRRWTPTSTASRAYKDINRLAFKLLNPGGLLLTFSCSGGIGGELFHKIVAGAGLDAGVDGYLLRRLEATSDHQTTVTFPEGEYLKGLAIVRKD